MGSMIRTVTPISLFCPCSPVSWPFRNPMAIGNREGVPGIRKVSPRPRGQSDLVSIRLSNESDIGPTKGTRPHTFGARVRLVFVLTRLVPDVTHVHRHCRLGLLLRLLHPVVQNFEELLRLLVTRHKVVKGFLGGGRTALQVSTTGSKLSLLAPLIW